YSRLRGTLYVFFQTLVKLSTLSPEPVIPAKKPFKVELVGGKKQPFCDGNIWLCGCKHTSNPPYCDGTHKQDFIVSAPLHEPAES
uniref:Iron-binding zinc finger CDGSH type domain-containing protein n=1 Tax=Astatotilapia calliptera TaxID=8154 RepID=A0AAX7UHP1_ASTCA